MFIETIVVGRYEVNCYIISGDMKECIIIDPGFEYEKIFSVIEQKKLRPKILLNTHAHADHIGTNGKWGLPIWIGRGDADFLEDPAKNLSALFAEPLLSPPAGRLLEDQEVISLCGLKLHIHHTPGHTPGGICIACKDVIFTGDTLFCGSVGRTDLPYGDGRTLIRSIKEKLLPFSDDTIVYPGHGPSTTIGYEREHNFFLR